MIIPTWFFALRGFDETLVLRGEESDRRILLVGILDIEFDEDPVTRGVRQNLQRELIHVQVFCFLAVGITTFCVLKLGFDPPPELNDPLVKVILVWVDRVFRVAGYLEASQATLRRLRRKTDRSDEFWRFACKKL